MLSFMRIRTCTCACTYTWECECTYTHTCMYMCSAYKQRKSSYQKLTPKHKGKNQNGHHAKHSNFTRCVHTSPIPMPRWVRNMHMCANVHIHASVPVPECVHVCTHMYNVHSTWKPEKPSNQTSMSEGKMAAMLRSQQHTMHVHTCTYTCTWMSKCTWADTRKYICSNYKPGKSSYTKLKSNRKRQKSKLATTPSMPTTQGASTYG